MRAPHPAIACTLALALASALAAPTAGAGPVRHSIVVLIDGARWSETFGDPAHTWVPRMWQDLAPIGCRADAYRNLGQTLTVPGTSAVLCGNWQALPNDGSELSHFPSLFECWRLASGAPATDAWIVTTKDKLLMLAASDHPAAGPAWAGSSSLQANDVAACTKARQVLAQYHPAVMHLHLGDTDVAAHTGSWSGYTTALRRADSLVAVLWQAVQADTALAGSTALFVTNDHGRHLDANGGFQNHGDSCDGCRHILLLALGAGVRSGVVATSPCSQIDVLPTIAELMGFAAPWAQGTVMHELLTASVGAAPDAGGASIRVSASPNPSNGPVRLDIVLTRPARVRLAVFDPAGRVVARPFTGALGEGRHAFTWDGRDDGGRAVAPGRYVLRLEDGQGTTGTTIVRLR